MQKSQAKSLGFFVSGEALKAWLSIAKTETKNRCEATELCILTLGKPGCIERSEIPPAGPLMNAKIPSQKLGIFCFR
jgi:hypothetical protein